MVGMTARIVRHSYSAIFLAALTEDRYYIDTGASICIINNDKFLDNVRDCEPVTLQGATGARQVTQMGDLTLWAKGQDGAYHAITVPDVLLDPLCPANLISAKQMIVANGAQLHLGGADQNFLAFERADNELRLMLEEVNGLYALVTRASEDAQDIATDASINPSASGAPSSA
jgi:hypothetical protein